MTTQRYDALNHPASVLELTEQEISEGWHFCYDFDGLLIGPGMGELNSCGCLPKDHAARLAPIHNEEVEPYEITEVRIPDSLKGIPFVFWICPKGCRGNVEWARGENRMIATCAVCGEKSKPIA